MKRWFWGLIGLLCIALLVMVITSKYSQPKPAPKPVLEEPVALPKIHIEVLNGCGADGVATRLSDRLREHGLDVITQGNAENFNFPDTIVIDRTGKPDYARQVANLLGTKNHIQQMTPDPFRIEEVTIVIGRDYARLPILANP